MAVIDPNDLTNSIAQNAQGPAKATGDQGSMEQHPLPDQIAADRYLASKKAMRTPGFGVRSMKMVPPCAD